LSGRGPPFEKRFDTVDAGRCARLKIVQRRNMELKNAVLEGSLVPAEAIAPNWARVMRAVRTAMLAVPGKARFRLPYLTPQDMNPIDPRNPSIVRCGAFFEDRAQRLSN
jgi:phage terminase Nu1 subunit (DNA packaging protein)